MNLCMKNYIVEYIRQCAKSMGSQMSNSEWLFDLNQNEFAEIFTKWLQ